MPHDRYHGWNCRVRIFALIFQPSFLINQSIPFSDFACGRKKLFQGGFCAKYHNPVPESTEYFTHTEILFTIFSFEFILFAFIYLIFESTDVLRFSSFLAHKWGTEYAQHNSYWSQLDLWVHCTSEIHTNGFLNYLLSCLHLQQCVVYTHYTCSFSLLSLQPVSTLVTIVCSYMQQWKVWVGQLPEPFTTAGKCFSNRTLHC